MTIEAESGPSKKMKRSPSGLNTGAARTEVAGRGGAKVATLTATTAFALLAMTATVFAQGLFEGARQGSERGNAAAGPVGGIVGGAVGAGVGTVNGALGIRPGYGYRRYHHCYYRYGRRHCR